MEDWNAKKDVCLFVCLVLFQQMKKNKVKTKYFLDDLKKSVGFQVCRFFLVAVARIFKNVCVCVCAMCTLKSMKKKCFAFFFHFLDSESLSMDAFSMYWKFFWDEKTSSMFMKDTSI